MSDFGGSAMIDMLKGAITGVSLYSCDKQWQIEIDVPRIYY